MSFKTIRKKSKLYSILFSLLLLSPVNFSVLACVEMTEPEEIRYMLFNPNLLEKKEWWSFFYNGKWSYMEGSVQANTDELIIAKEWIQQMHATASAADATDYLFNSLPDSSIRVNPFYKDILKQPTYNNYFTLAKEAETLLSTIDPWEDMREKKNFVKDMINLTEKIQTAHRLEKNTFLQKRYAFQLLRLYYYSGDFKKLKELYSSYFNSPHTPIDWWATHYLSKAYGATQQTDSSNYLHALVFSHSSNKMFSSKQNFNNKRLNEVVLLAKNKEEQADIYLLNEIINPWRSLEGINKVYQLNSNHPQLPLLINREINKIEDWLGTTKYVGSPVTTKFWDFDDRDLLKNWNNDFNYLQTFYASLSKMDELEKSQPDYFHITLAYLSLMKKDASSAREHLTKVKNTNTGYAYQKNVLEIILLTQEEDIRSQSCRQKMGEKMNLLVQNRDKNFESQKILFSLCNYLKYIFEQKKLISLAGLFDYYAQEEFCYTCTSDSYNYSLIRYFDEKANAKDIEQLIQLFNQPKKTQLEEFLLKPYTHTYYFYDVLATKYLRTADLIHAKEALDKIPDSFWDNETLESKQTIQDPFKQVQDLNTKTLNTFNKREIVTTMILLEQEAKNKKEKSAENYFLLGNAWYNFNHNSWFMLSYGYSLESHDYEEFANSKAMQYYKIALAAETSDEQKAKISYMMAVCSNAAMEKAYALQYESFSKTDFYKRKNCFTTRDLAGK